VSDADKQTSDAGAGRVYLVGAGPGDPGLMTRRALDLIARADVLLYDRLIPDGALDGAREDAELVYVGKQGGGASVAQSDTEMLMLARACEGKVVVRLKGGDPFVFGRGGEEALALSAAGVPFEIVPGVTAGIAAPAYAGIPVTQRGLASAVALVTGHEDPAKSEEALDWSALAAFPGTLVLYMGVTRLEHIARALIAAGRDAEEPAAVVEAGTLPGQRTVRAPLRSLAEAAAAHGIQSPAVTVVGPVSELAAELAWHVPGPLGGRTVAVTRARAQASEMARRLRELGARVIEAPVIHIRPLPAPPDRTLELGGFDLICLTSPNGVRALFERMALAGLDARALAGARIAAIGPGTARALSEHGIRADVVPERYVAESLLEALEAVPVRRALIARAVDARDVLPEGLRARGAEVEVLALYETVAEPLAEGVLEAVLAADYITFTSSSTVAYFIAAAGAEPQLSAVTRTVSIGPVTSAALLAAGLQADVEAQSHDIDGVIDAILADCAERIGRDAGG
jgi:uroporphyrinogen III methyltransferase/synthase